MFQNLLNIIYYWHDNLGVFRFHEIFGLWVQKIYVNHCLLSSKNVVVFFLSKIFKSKNDLNFYLLLKYEIKMCHVQCITPQLGRRKLVLGKFRRSWEPQIQIPEFLISHRKPFRKESKWSKSQAFGGLWHVFQSISHIIHIFFFFSQIFHMIFW